MQFRDLLSSDYEIELRGKASMLLTIDTDHDETVLSTTEREWLHSLLNDQVLHAPEEGTEPSDGDVLTKLNMLIVSKCHFHGSRLPFGIFIPTMSFDIPNFVRTESEDEDDFSSNESETEDDDSDSEEADVNSGSEADSESDPVSDPDNDTDSDSCEVYNETTYTDVADVFPVDV